MDNCNDALDWKKVFKKILNCPEQTESSRSPESTRKTNSVGNIKYQGSGLHESITLSSKTSSTSFNDISKDNVNQSSSFHETTLEPTSEFFIEKGQDWRNSTQLSYNVSKNDKSNQVPEWNKVFKSILGKKSSNPATENKKLTSAPIKQQKNFQKCDTFVNTRSASREKFYKVPEPVDPEEEKVRELFARSRMFKRNCYSLNDFDGAGVDIFKYDNKVKFTDKALQYESHFEPYITLEGFVAKFKPYTTAELIASPKVPFIEPPWDDDLLM